MANSYVTKQRPSKPYPEFPLFAHNNGQWCRKIRGKLYAFGKWDDHNAALESGACGVTENQSHRGHGESNSEK